MKRILSILFSLLIILSGIHFRIATHYCGGEVASVKFSVSGEKATCGMKTDNINFPSKTSQFSTNCCDDEISVYAVDSNYTPSSFQIKVLTQNVLQFFTIPINISFQFLKLSIYLLVNFSLPDMNIASAVSLADICVFRN